MNNGYQNDNYTPSYMNLTGVENSVNNASTPSSNMSVNTSNTPNFVNNTKVNGALNSFNAPFSSFNSRMLASDIGLNFLKEDDVKPVELEQTTSLPDKLDVLKQNENYEIKEDKTSKRIIIILLIIIAVLSIIIALLVLKLFTTKNFKVNATFNERFLLNTVATSFFIKNKNDDYALYDVEGNKISDFIYNKTSSFYNNISVVSYDGEVGVIDDKNNEIIDFGSYIDIEFLSGLLKVTNSFYDDYLLDNEGNILVDLKDKKVLKSDNNGYVLLEDTINKKYILFGSDGSELLTLTIKDDTAFPISNIFKNYLSFYYDNNMYIYDMDSLSKISEFKSDKEYQIEFANDEVLILSSINNSNKEKKLYKFIMNNNVYNLSTLCDEIKYDGGLICVKDNTSYLLKTNLEKGLLIDDNSSYFNSENYVYDDGVSIYFYKDDMLQNEITCRKLISRGPSNNVYVLTGNKECGLSEEEYRLFDAYGNSISDEVYNYVSSSDDNGLNIVKSKDKYYLINSKGEKISEEYNYIEYSLGYYIVKDDMYGIIDKNGNTILDLKYNSVSISYIRNNYYALLDSKLEYILYNISEDKEIYVGNTKPLLNNNYILVIEDGKNKLYSYINGKEFYEI